MCFRSSRCVTSSFWRIAPSLSRRVVSIVEVFGQNHHDAELMQELQPKRVAPHGLALSLDDAQAVSETLQPMCS